MCVTENPLLTKKTFKVHLHVHLPGIPQEIVSVELDNTRNNDELKTKLKAAIKPSLANKYVMYMTFHIGDMKLDLYKYRAKDGDLINVKCPAWERDENEKQELLNHIASSMTSHRKVDIVFSFDTSGSMCDFLHKIQKGVRESVICLLSDIPDIRIGLIAHSDYCDEYRYVLKKHKLSSNKAKLVKFIDKTAGSFTDSPCSCFVVWELGEGGSDNLHYACYEWVLRKANGLSWREDAAKALVVIGDEVPHPSSYTSLKINWRDELDRLCEKGVKVYGVRGGYNTEAKCFYSYMARKSGGAYIAFEHFSQIANMLIAVWYRASGDDLLKAYVEKLKKEGRMTDDMMDIIRLLKKTPEEKVKDEEKDEERKEEEKEEESGKDEEEKEVANETGSEGAECTQPDPQGPQEEEYLQPTFDSWWDADLRKSVPIAWWDETLDQSDRATYNYIYSMNYWTRKDTYSTIYNLRPALRKSLRFKTLRRGCSAIVGL